jgi:hypothetical protein
MFSFKLSSSRGSLYAKVDSEIHAFTPNTDEYALSLSRYIMGHKLKVQTEISYEDKILEHSSKLVCSFSSRDWYIRRVL